MQKKENCLTANDGDSMETAKAINNSSDTRWRGARVQLVLPAARQSDYYT